MVITPRDFISEGMNRDDKASYTGDLFAMLGTLFLFLFWPSFKYVRTEERVLGSLTLTLAITLNFI